MRVSRRDDDALPLRGLDQRGSGELQRGAHLERLADGEISYGDHRRGFVPPNAWGLYDLHGNVWECCADVSVEYTGDERTDPNRDADTSDYPECVLRGGAWDGPPGNCRAAYRNWIPPEIRLGTLGFRVCFRLD